MVKILDILEEQVSCSGSISKEIQKEKEEVRPQILKPK